jgi:DNA-binding NarL/FixJ family response regulator
VTTRVLVIDDQELLRNSFRILIDAEADLSVVGEVADGAQAVQMAARTSPDVIEYVFRALRAGAGGFALKSCPLEELLAAIRVVASGGALLAPSVTTRLVARFTREPNWFEAAPRDLADLTPREREVLVSITRSLSNSEVAGHLHLSVPTVKTHIGRLLAKLGARDRAQRVIVAYESDLVRCPFTGPWIGVS